MSSSQRSPFQKYGPVFFTGLYFFLCAAASLSAQEPRLLPRLTPLFSYVPFSPTDFPDSTELRFNSTFNPLYSETDKATRGDQRNVGFSAHGYSAEWFSRFRRVNYYLSCNRYAGAAIYRDTSENYGVTFRRSGWDLSAGAAFRYGNLQFGFGLGRHLPAHMDREHLYEIRDNVGSYITKGPWQFSCGAKGTLGPATAQLSLFSGPVHSSLTKLETSDKANYRSFPLSIILHRANCGIDVHAGSFGASATVGIDYAENADLLIVENSMPQDVAVRRFRLHHHGFTKMPFTDSLSWHLSGSLAGGWVAGYNFKRERLTFFKAERIRQNDFSASIGLQLPTGITAAVFHTMLKGKSPSGLLKLSALSAWSVFQPLDYQYNNASLQFREIGVVINRRFSLPFLDITPQLALSHITANATTTYSHKEVVVLLPVYVDTVTTDFLDMQLLLLEGGLSLSARLGKILVQGTVSQKIPFLRQSPAAAADTVPETNPAPPVTIRGGTMMSLSAVWHIPQPIGVSHNALHSSRTRSK